MTKFKLSLFATGFAGVALLAAGCGSNNATTSTTAPEGAMSAQNPAAAGSGLTGQIRGDGSSTVFPITEAMAEEFQKDHPDVKVTVGISGTGGGFKKFVSGDTELQNASRPIAEKEAATAVKNKREYIEMPIAYDGIAIIANPKNDWVKCLSVEQLKKIWEPNSKITSWKQIDPKFPDRPLKLYGPGTDSGTFDYFTKEINGKEKASRADYTASEDDNTLVQGVSRDIGALGYFGFAYYEENMSKLKLVDVSDGGACVTPSSATISSNAYTPLSRPMFIYIGKDAAEKPEVQEFVKFSFANALKLVPQVGYVPLSAELYTAAQKRFDARVTGTAYKNEAAYEKSLMELYGK